MEGITELAQDEAVAGISGLVAMVLTRISIAVGVLLGLLVSGSTHARDRRIAPP